MTGAQPISPVRTPQPPATPATPAGAAQSSEAWATEGVSVQSGVMSNFAEWDSDGNGMLTQVEVNSAITADPNNKPLGGFALAVMKYDGSVDGIKDGDLSMQEINNITEFTPAQKKGIIAEAQKYSAASAGSAVQGS